MRPPGPVTRTCMPPTESPKWSPIACTESRKASSPGLPSRLANRSAPLPSGEYSTRALLMGSAPLLSQASPAATTALSACVSGAVALYTTMIGVPLASGKDACCSAAARLLSTFAGSDLEASLLVTLCSLGPAARPPAMSTHTAMMIHGCLPRVLQVMMSRMSPSPPVSYTHLRAHETRHDLVCRLLLEKKKQ